MTTQRQTQRDERVKDVSLLKRLLSRPEFGAAAGALLVFILFSLITVENGVSQFLVPKAVITWLEFSAQVGIIGVGATLLMVGGEFDLSVGSMIGAASIMCLAPVVLFGWLPWQAILLSFALALLIGYINGALVNRTGLPSFIVTLAFLFILRGLTLVVTRALTGTTRVDVQSMLGQNEIFTVNQAKAFIQSDWLAQFFSGEILQPLFTMMSNWGWIATLPNGNPSVTGLPVTVLWWIGLSILATWALQHTRFGNWIFGIGGDAESSRNTGVPVALVRILLFMCAAVCATIFAVLQVYDFGSADTLRGNLKEFEAIIVAVIGGTLLTGGYGSPVGAFFGALIYGMTFQGIFIANGSSKPWLEWLNTDYFRVVLGLLLLGAVLFNTFIRKRATEAK